MPHKIERICFLLFLSAGLPFVPIASFGEHAVIPQAIQTAKGHSVWYLQTKNSPVTSIVIHYPLSYLSLPAMDGIPNSILKEVAESLFVKRNQHFTAKESASLLQKHNASLEIDITPYGVAIAIDFITTTKEELATFYQAAIHAPSFAEKDLISAKNRFKNDLVSWLKEPDFRLSREFRSQMFGTSLWGKASFATLASVENITVENLQRFYRSWHQTEPFIVMLTSMDEKDALSYVESITHYEQDSTTEDLKPPTVTINGSVFGEEVKLIDDTLEQANLCFVLPGLAEDDKNYPSLVILTTILNEEYLLPAIRREKGLAYSVQSFPLTYPNAGFVIVETSTHHTQVEEVKAIIVDILAHIKSHPIDQQMIDKTVANVIRQLALGLDSNKAIVSYFYRMKRDGYTSDASVAFAERFSGITTERLQNLIHDLWQDTSPFLATIGPS